MANGKDSGYKIQFQLLQASWISGGKAGGVEFYWQEIATGTYRSYSKERYIRDYPIIRGQF